MKRKLFLSVCISMLLLSVACNKYKDGPALSLRSKTERVANSWKVGQALDNGDDVTSSYNKFELDLSKGGSASLSAEYNFFGNDYKYTTTGSWAFVSNKEKLSLDFDNDAGDNVYRILRLKEKEMWLKDDDGSLELHLVPR